MKDKNILFLSLMIVLPLSCMGMKEGEQGAGILAHKQPEEQERQQREEQERQQREEQERKQREEQERKEREEIERQHREEQERQQREDVGQRGLNSEKPEHEQSQDPKGAGGDSARGGFFEEDCDEDNDEQNCLQKSVSNGVSYVTDNTVGVAARFGAKVVYDAGAVGAIVGKQSLADKVAKFLGIYKIKECAETELAEEEKGLVNSGKRNVAKMIIFLGESDIFAGVMGTACDATVITAIEYCSTQEQDTANNFKANVIAEGGGRVIAGLYNHAFGEEGIIGSVLNRDGVCASVVHRGIKEGLKVFLIKDNSNEADNEDNDQGVFDRARGTWNRLFNASPFDE